MTAIVGFFGALSLVLYTLFGYPLLLAVWSRWRASPIRRAPFEPSVSLIIAVHDGEAFLEAKLVSVLALDYPRENMQVLVVSDGSEDETDSIAQRFASQGVQLLRISRAGKSSALNAGIAESRGALLVFTDVRQVLAPNSLRLLLENFADPKVGAASAELVIRKGPTQEEADTGLYWRYEAAIRRRLSALDSIFGATGAYYAIRRELAVPLPPATLLDDMYLPLAAFFRGYRLVVDSRARMFDYPTALRSEFRRKVRTLAGNYQILCAYPQLLGWKNRMWLHFWSYKFARLLLPFALLAMVLLGLGLPAPLARVVTFGQAAFYAVAVIDFLVPERWWLKRLTSPIRTFVALMAAALCALSFFFLPASALWRSTQLVPKSGSKNDT